MILAALNPYGTSALARYRVYVSNPPITRSPKLSTVQYCNKVQIVRMIDTLTQLVGSSAPIISQIGRGATIRSNLPLVPRSLPVLLMVLTPYSSVAQ